MKHLAFIVKTILGALLVVAPVWLPIFVHIGLAPIGPMLGITLVVFSLFGELPSWLSWMQKLGETLYPGVFLGTLVLLLRLLFPVPTHESSLFAISPAVWAAYISIVLVGISFETSSLPIKIFDFCKTLPIAPCVLIPLYVTIFGLLGNILDGVSIMIISAVILLHMLPREWAMKALFALLFGGLISNLITVAAEPTNIKFQDSLGVILNQLHPSFWVTNWPICILGILFPSIVLGVLMKQKNVAWHETQELPSIMDSRQGRGKIDVLLATTAMVLLGTGVIAHAVFENISSLPQIPLWLLLLPAGIAACCHLFVTKTFTGAYNHIKEQSPVWIKLMVIFSLLWFLQNGLPSGKSIMDAFFVLSSAVQYFFLVLLSLASSVTDNVALAAMQGSILVSHPISIWQTRLLLVLLTWSGGLTPFGCLQSLSLNHRLKLSTGKWLMETPIWAGLAILGGLLGLFLSTLLYRL